MSSQVRTVRQDSDLRSTIRAMQDDQRDHVIVVDDAKRYLGFVCRSHPAIVAALSARAESSPLSQLEVRNVMRTDVGVVSMDQSLDQVLSIMAMRSIRAVPVIDGGGVFLGVVSYTAVFRCAKNDPLLHGALQRFETPPLAPQLS